MKYSIELRDDVFDRDFTYCDDFDYESLGDLLFIWIEGNYSCDCNRHIFMYPDDNKDRVCNTGANSIQLIRVTSEDGEVVYELA